MSVDQETINVYDAKAAQYDALVHDADDDAHLKSFIAALPAAGRVLDLGCGPGSASARMRDHGLQVTALDASPEMVALAKSKFGLEARLGTFDDVTETNLYDGIWASFSLLHAPRDQFPHYLAAIHRALKPKGQFCIGMKTGTDERRDGLGRQYTYYTEQELRDHLLQTGFTISQATTGASAGLDGVVAPWIIIHSHA